MSVIQIENLIKDFSKKNINIEIIKDLSFEIKEGEFVAFFGPNGCGKTTLLNIISGIDEEYSGKVLIDKKEPKKSKTGFVFQNYNESMLPWRTVIGNVELALEIQNIPKEKRKEIAENILKKAGLIEHKNKYFYELSGGMKQLTAICRAFAYNPNLLIMDEPFSSLDYSTSRKMWVELLDMWRENKKTTLFVSHDIDEAIFLADKVIILSQRPARIKGILKINLPRPRKLEMISQKEFFETRNKILELFENGQE